MRFSHPMTVACAALSLVLPPLAATAKTAKHGKPAMAGKRAPGVYATLDTTAGKITARLYEKEAPKTVANFIGLASGTKAWTDPKTSKQIHRPLYNGTIFHRVIKGFMIQGGDPLGNGTGGPGYQFADEMPAGPQYDYTPGTLAMANSGSNTNGSQFFIMHGDFSGKTDPNKHLPKSYNIFGKVVDGMSVVDKIATAPLMSGDRSGSKPEKPVSIRKITITRVK